MICCYSDDLTEGERVIESLRKFKTLIVDQIQPLPFPAMQSMLDPAFPDGNQNYWKSSLLRELSDGTIEVILEQVNSMPSTLAAVVVEYYGGAAGRVKDADTAFPHRQLPWDAIAIAQWSDPADSSQNRTWARRLNEGLARSPQALTY